MCLCYIEMKTFRFFLFLENENQTGFLLKGVYGAISGTVWCIVNSYK